MALITLGRKSLPTGSILQVTDQVMISTQQTTSSDTYHDLTGATLNITPTSTSSKILLQTTINVETDTANSAHGLRFYRDSTIIFTTTQRYMVLGTSAGDRYTTTYTYVDSPSSTSQLTYKIQIASHGNKQIHFQNSAQTTFIAMEIQG